MTWDSWVTEQGLYYSQHGRQREHVYTSSHCTSPWRLTRAMGGVQTEACTLSRLHYERGKVSLVTCCFTARSEHTRSLSWRVRSPRPQGFSLQTQPRQTSVWTLHYWQTHCIELNGSPHKDISTSQSPKSVNITLFRRRGFEPEALKVAVWKMLVGTWTSKPLAVRAQKEMRDVLLETGGKVTPVL